MNDYIILQDEFGNTAFFYKPDLLWAQGVFDGEQIMVEFEVKHQDSTRVFSLYYRSSNEVFELMERIRSNG